jgi:hypothetical protein
MSALHLRAEAGRRLCDQPVTLLTDTAPTAARLHAYCIDWAITPCFTENNHVTTIIDGVGIGTWLPISMAVSVRRSLAVSNGLRHQVLALHSGRLSWRQATWETLCSQSCSLATALVRLLFGNWSTCQFIICLINDVSGTRSDLCLSRLSNSSDWYVQAYESGSKVFGSRPRFHVFEWTHRGLLTSLVAPLPSYVHFQAPQQSACYGWVKVGGFCAVMRANADDWSRMLLRVLATHSTRGRCGSSTKLTVVQQFKNFMPPTQMNPVRSSKIRFHVLFFSGFPTNISQAPLHSAVRATCAYQLLHIPRVLELRSFAVHVPGSTRQRAKKCV